MVNAIEARGLVKRFGDRVVVNGINLDVPAASVCGLLGPNGAGKTTTIRMLTTLSAPSGGRISLLGNDVVTDAARVRRKIGLTGQLASVDQELTGRENLILIARLQGFGWRAAGRRADQLLDAFDLAKSAREQVATFSGGMRRRLDIASSLVTRPQILFLDEPTTGLDPRSRNQVWDLVRTVKAAGTTVLLTTQYLEEADQLADRLAVIDHGHIIAEGTSGSLKARVGGRQLDVRLADAADRDQAHALLTAKLGGSVRLGDQPDLLSVRVTDERLVPDALTAVMSSGITVESFALAQPSLDDVFFALTGHGAAPESDEVAA